MTTHLFDGEEIREARGYPLLVRFFPGDPARPLVVFFPGWAHLGRIAYGAPGRDPANFPAHWISRKGYPFLATSYPLDHPVYDRPRPEFTLADWGDSVADVARALIVEHGLCDELIGISWSAAGQAIRPFNVACGRIGLRVRWHLAIEATPAMLLPPARTRGIERTARNMMSLKRSHYAVFWSEVEAMSRLSGREILSEELYLKAFVGDIPVGLLGTTQWFEAARIDNDVEKSVADKDFFAFADYPMVAALSGSSPDFAYHPIVDRSTWSFLVTHKIYHGLLEQHLGMLGELSSERFELLLDLLHQVRQRLHASIPGNHFCFLGPSGGQAVADSIDRFSGEIEAIKGRLGEIAGIDASGL